MSRAAAKAPSANRGPTNLNGEGLAPAIIDFLRFTIPQAILGCYEPGTAFADCLRFLGSLAPGAGLCLELEVKAGRRGYESHYEVLTPDGQPCGDICWGGERQLGTSSIELTGAGCALISAARPFAAAWGHVRCLLDTVGGKITRVDVAHDDYAGVHSLASAVEMYEAGAFDGAFARPAMNQQGWNDGSGRTVYIGKKTATKQLAVYEKGREQGLRDGDAGVEWVRWEARFNNRNKEIPLELLEAPWEYMVGQYPALDWISAVMSVMVVAVKRSVANLAGAVRHCRRQFGSLLGLVAKHQMDDEMIGRFVRLKLARASSPGWLKENPLGRVSLGRAFASLQLAV
ncbi:MAG TPA: replication initiation factor domain-containing protein [Rhodanobacter sp.]|jgi:DNA relaxase NicK|nr:replication initiation factor domain-containing protein [Rhodanobacter sp.]